jgi:hypothetical protein
MTSRSPSKEQGIVVELREQLQRQWEQDQYEVTVEQAYDVLNRLGAVPGLLTDCLRLNVNLTHMTQMIWDIGVAHSRTDLLGGLISKRKQAQNTLNVARRRAPSERKLDDPALTEEEVEHYVRARFHPSKNAIERLTGAIGKFSNPPGAEREPHQPIRKGRRAENADWLVDRLYKRLSSIPKLKYAKRMELLGRILACSGFLMSESDFYQATEKKLSRMTARRRSTLK